ncbi:hypothetical protein [Mesorhizobium sp. M6A.T.Cr.TU.016.01.1.1]|uniref:hypothetical protein n=1 Tax=Mesorhizobium sp. M6A.T.Cr.TU.016.01.1.1 TaxID=2493677 RepID=UPI000F74DACF|nr:hypothetical protein [Mesorhizobium sp. M6A.T.Cr.TU.016.01.1.1]AZO68418.1 hypothetical protein EJ075_28225 [Mesorhizobium sp. M6A.T.Cr.TU.016.01.1.1]
MRRIHPKQKKQFIKELDVSLNEKMRQEAYWAFLEELKRVYHRGCPSRTERNDLAHKITDIISAKEDPYVIECRVVARDQERMTLGTSLRVYADEENSQARDEATRYPVSAFRAMIGQDRAEIFNGYVPFRITPHALIRIIERSKVAYQLTSSGTFGMAAVTRSLGDIVEALPLHIIAALSTGQTHFGLRIADGILLCETFEETTYYEAGYVEVDCDGARPIDGQSIFGNPENGVSRVILAKTWIGPHEVRPEQERLISEIEAVLSKQPELSRRLMEADFFRIPNWIDRNRPKFEPLPSELLAEIIVPAAKIMMTSEYHAQFTPSEVRRKV